MWVFSLDSYNRIFDKDTKLLFTINIYIYLTKIIANKINTYS